MKVKLYTSKADVRAYGLDFDEAGECEVDRDVAQSLIDTGVLVEVPIIEVPEIDTNAAIEVPVPKAKK